MIEFNKDKARIICRKDTNEQRKRAKIVKTKEGRTTKVYAINIERNRILKQREKVLQSTKDRKLGNANTPVALLASIRANRASKDTQNIIMTDNAVTAYDNTDNAVIGHDNIDNATTDGDNTDDATTDDDSMDNAIIGEASTVHVHSMVEKLKIKIKLRHPQNMQVQLQNLQQVTPFWMVKPL